MALPIANAGVGGADIPYADWIVPGGASRALADGGSTPGTGGSSIASRQWTILDSIGSASLTGSTTATPSLDNIDANGDVRIMLVVTDDLGAISETNPFLAPQSAFVVVKATSRYSALPKSAIGERDYIANDRAVVDEVDSLRGEAWLEIGGGASGSLSNKVTATQFATTSPDVTLVTDYGFKFRGEFVNVVAAGDVADIELWMSPTANIVADGTKITGITVDATCSAVLTGYIRIVEAGVSVSLDAEHKKKGATVPAEVVPDVDCAIAYAFSNARFAWVINPAGAGTWTAGSTSTKQRAKFWRQIGKQT